VVAGAAALGGAAAPVLADPPDLSISGSHFTTGANDVRLVGVDVPSSEYACEQGWGYSSGDGPVLAAQIAAWGVNAVRIPLNEDCWLGINGEPAYGTAAGYQAAIEGFVSDLAADGIYSILDLHWSAPGAFVADGQEPMPDDNSVNFWSSVAALFKSDHGVVFDLFNEPFSPAASGYGADTVSWSCWLSGGCTVPVFQDTAPVSPAASYQAVGMQQLVDAVRAAGADQPIMVGGLQYAEDLSGWLTHEPVDSLPVPQIAASFHNYEGDGICDEVSCWGSVIAPIAAEVPVVTGEFAQDECGAADDGFDDSYMSWADQHGVSYLAWGWFVGATPDCNDYYLVDADGSPASPNGVALHDHLQALGAPSGLTTTSTTTTTTPVNLNPQNPACIVPRVAGDTLAKARTRLRDAHCRVGKITGPATHGPLVVASSDPRAGRHLHNGARVALRLRPRRRRSTLHGHDE